MVTKCSILDLETIYDPEFGKCIVTKELFSDDITSDTIIGYHDDRLFIAMLLDHYKFLEGKDLTKYGDHATLRLFVT